ncbi:MAG: aminotransferase class IV [Trueperaceae bacterium]|nr:aminotransferase class IV [Trueperaceae bacterium]
MPESSTRGTHQAVPDPRNRDVLVWIDGELVRRADAKVSVFDSAFLVGDGVWEGLRLVNGRFAHLERHLDRLFQGAAAIGLDIGRTRAELHDALRATVEANGMQDGCHVRLMVSRGEKSTPSQDPRLVRGGPTIVIIAEHKRADPEVGREGIRLATSATRRPPPDTLDPKLNCHSKLHEVVALVQALQAGADEALMLDVRGFVATCNATNFFVVRQGEVWTSTAQYCLNGITRALILEIARDLNVPARECDFSLTEVYDADEAFVTGTFGGLTPVTHVDGRRIGGAVPGPVTQRLADRYGALMMAQGGA